MGETYPSRQQPHTTGDARLDERGWPPESRVCNVRGDEASRAGMPRRLRSNGKTSQRPVMSSPSQGERRQGPRPAAQPSGWASLKPLRRTVWLWGSLVRSAGVSMRSTGWPGDSILSHVSLPGSENRARHRPWHRTARSRRMQEDDLRGRRFRPVWRVESS